MILPGSSVSPWSQKAWTDFWDFVLCLATIIQYVFHIISYYLDNLTFEAMVAISILQNRSSVPILQSFVFDVFWTPWCISWWLFCASFPLRNDIRLYTPKFQFKKSSSYQLLELCCQEVKKSKSKSKKSKESRNFLVCGNPVSSWNMLKFLTSSFENPVATSYIYDDKIVS